MIGAVPPGLVMLLGAALLLCTRGTAQLAVLIGAPVLALLATLSIPDGAALSVGFLQYQVAVLYGSGLARALAGTLLLAVLALALYLRKSVAVTELVAAYAAAGFALGVVLAGDLIAVFLNWDLLALAATALIWSAGTEAARAAGIRFLVMQLMGGIVFKLGMDGAYAFNGSYVLGALPLDAPFVWALLVGILVKAAAWPVSVWLPDAYCNASPTAPAWLSLLLPATATYMVLVVFGGSAVLLAVGALMGLYGVVYALLQDSRRRQLCHLLVAYAGLVIALAALPATTSISVVLAIVQLPLFAMLFAAAASASSDQVLRGETSAISLRNPVDTDWVWRVLLFRLGRAVVEWLATLRAALERIVLARLEGGRRWLTGLASGDGVLARSWGIGLTSLWVAVLLVAYVLIYML